MKVSVDSVVSEISELVRAWPIAKRILLVGFLRELAERIERLP